MTTSDDRQDEQKCPACSQSDLREVLKEKLVTFIFPVPNDLIEKVTRESISISECLKCGHVFQKNVDRSLIERIYGDFYRHYNLDTSEQFQGVYAERTLNFFERTLDSKGKQGGTMLDIGCGEGELFPYFLQQGYECCGYEPSAKYLIAEDRYPIVQVRGRFFGATERDQLVSDEKFDVIVINWVLEHVIDLDEFMLTLRSACKPGTKVFIQVPDLRYYLENDLYLFYVHEHIHYFSSDSLSELLRREGFTVYDVEQGDCPSLLVCAVYLSDQKNSLGCDQTRNRLNLMEFISQGRLVAGTLKLIFKNYEKIVFYGAGTTTYWTAEFCLDEESKKKVEVIDDNEFYWGKVAPSFNVQISGMYNIEAGDKTLFFIGTSPVYRDRIIKKIEEKVSGKFEIGYLDNNEVKIIEKQID